MLNNLQAARAFAAMNVVLLHVILGAADYGIDLRYFSGLRNWGSNGVDIFFVISGFIMVYVNDRRSRSPSEFLADRAARILPLYWVMTITMTGLFVIANAIVNNSVPSIDHLVASLLLMSRALIGIDPVLYVGWTLEYEALFYCVFAIGIAIAGLIRSNRSIIFIVVGALSSLVAIGALRPLVLEFLFGAVLARLMPLISTRWAWFFLVAGGAAMLASIGYDVDIEERWLYWGIPAAVLILGCVSTPQCHSGIITRLGNMSYSLYLSHVFVVSVLLKLHSNLPMPVDGDLWALVILAVALGVGWLVHRLIEVPLAPYAKRWFGWLTQPTWRKAASARG